MYFFLSFFLFYDNYIISFILSRLCLFQLQRNYRMNPKMCCVWCVRIIASESSLGGDHLHDGTPQRLLLSALRRPQLVRTEAIRAIVTVNIIKVYDNKTGSSLVASPMWPIGNPEMLSTSNFYDGKISCNKIHLEQFSESKMAAVRC